MLMISTQEMDVHHCHRNDRGAQAHDSQRALRVPEMRRRAEGFLEAAAHASNPKEAIRKHRE
jgi:hypothetical protein